jgi:CysZ protein
LAAVPTFVFSLLLALLTWGSFAYIKPALSGFMPEPTSFYSKLGAEVVGYLGAILASVLGALLALAITPPLCAPALERIVLAQERQLGIPERQPLSFFAEMLCGLRAQLFAALFVLPILAGLWLIDLIVPAASIVTIPVKFLVASFGLAWNLFDYPLTLRGVRMRERFRLVMRHKQFTFGFGVAFALLFLLPCCTIVMLPIGVAAATRSLWLLLLADRELLPNLERPGARATQGLP